MVNKNNLHIFATKKKLNIMEEEIFALYDEGYDVEDIADELNLDVEDVIDVLENDYDDEDYDDEDYDEDEYDDEDYDEEEYDDDEGYDDDDVYLPEAFTF